MHISALEHINLGIMRFTNVVYNNIIAASIAPMVFKIMSKQHGVLTVFHRRHGYKHCGCFVP